MPTCGPCRRRRLFLGIAALPALLLAIIAWCALPVALEKYIGEMGVLFTALPGSLYLLWYGRNRLDQSLDRHLLGIWGATLDSERQTVTLGLSPRLAEAIEKAMEAQASKS